MNRLGRRLLPIPPLKLADWPAADQKAWGAARRADDPLEDPGLAAHWAANTADQTALAYGHWLAWLISEGELDPDAVPAGRVTLDRARRYLDWLRLALASSTVATMITRLHSMASALTPGAELGWLLAGATRLRRRAVPVKSKLPRLVESDRLLEAGMAMMAEATDRPLSPRTRALRYRDGLLIAFLALRPVRLANLAAMSLDRHLEFNEEGVWVRFAAAEVKNRRPLEFPWPTILLAPLRTYLEVHRPVLLEGADTPILWLGRLGPLSLKGVQQAVPAAVKRELGIAIPPHFFRDCAATTVATRDPEHARIIASILGHARQETAERYYNHARTLTAGRALQEIVRRHRERGRKRRPAVHRKAVP
jgi:integrase/recombinase XerD